MHTRRRPPARGATGAGRAASHVLLLGLLAIVALAAGTAPQAPAPPRQRAAGWGGSGSGTAVRGWGTCPAGGPLERGAAGAVGGTKVELQRMRQALALRGGGRGLAAVAALRGGQDDDEEDDFDEGMADEEFDEAAAGNRALQLWARTPYLTKRFFYTSFALSAYALIFNGNAWPALLDLDWSKIARGQVWRALAPFFCFGAVGINCLISMYFVWTYMGELERMYFKRPQDFAMLVGFGGACLLVATSLLGIHGQFLGHSLSCYLVYIWSREYEGVEVNVNDMFHLKAELLPWFFVAQTMVLDGEVPLLDILGIFVGYLYMQLKIRKLIKAPAPLTRFFKLPAIAKDYKRFEREFGVEHVGGFDGAGGGGGDGDSSSEGDDASLEELSEDAED